MSEEYIRKQDAFDAFEARIAELMTHPEFRRKHLDIDLSGVIRNISAIKPADVVPVVRCGQCGYWHDNDGDYGYCYAKDGQGFGHAWRKNDFCSYGERKGKYEID